MSDSKRMESIGKIVGIDGPVIGIEGLRKQKVGDLVYLGENRLVGEIIKIIGERTVVQCYDYTEGLKIGEKAENSGAPLSMELAPGLLNNIFDGIQRPLEELDSFIQKGTEVPSLSRKKKWHFKPVKKVGDKVRMGDVVGTVQETPTIEHRVLIPEGFEGEIAEINEGDHTIIDTIGKIKTQSRHKNLQMLQRWPIRRARPYLTHEYPNTPLITGMRVLDLLFPVARGGSVAVPGGFGTGKTVIQQSLAKFAHADIIIYIGCGERGNEMADILEQFPNLKDPRTGRPIMERTVLIGNTSNMPVSAREASIFSGLTIAEYYRDMGYNICLQADSTSRWAEALREVSGRLEEMPAEGGYPAYLATRLANFYERAGSVSLYGNHNGKGSVTLVGSVSPPSGDFSEPVTNTTKRFVRAFWALSSKLAYSRHYPAINWTDSYSHYADELVDWWNNNIGEGWAKARNQVSKILSEADSLENIVQLMGEENLPAEQQLYLFGADLIKEAFLIQNAFHDIDKYCSPEKTLSLIKTILQFYEDCRKVVRYVPVSELKSLDVLDKINRIKNTVANDEMDKLKTIQDELDKRFQQLKTQYRINKRDEEGEEE